ncbi:LytR/AlgR family response regulator transcription factor [Mucilaginibacter sp. P25]|uniref:DNA-binding response regulator, LytR/AlgR family n=1 Tax=Mucilaginibacter gossypii TaxID=551996 RepID=A0A1G8BMF3_9SPHI|nr:LytTR family DNA-binding domain-containing protein [Mucilaginibacter gossypii]SDH34331.1 DNA-binding response regulator, LytR/AlgR family [Mucilaginibacter gossypii]
MLKCCIIEDQPCYSTQVIKNHISDTLGLEFAGSFTGFGKGFDQVRRSIPDVCFINASMQRIAEADPAGMIGSLTTIVLITEEPNYALEAYDNEFFDYLLMPVSYKRFLQCMNSLKKLAKRLNGYSRENHFFIRAESRGKFIRINYSDIIFIEGALNYIQIHLTDGTKHKTYISLTDIYMNLSQLKFTRIHRSYIINNEMITEVNGNEVTVNGKFTFGIGAAYKNGFFESLTTKVIGARKTA